ncbi:MAG: DEAD/DEAH box helicase [Halobacteriales archaeon]
MEEVVDWLVERAAADGAVRHRHVEPGREACYGELEVHDRVAAALDDRGIDQFYRHQADAIGALRDGRDVAVSTPTASGKSLIYTVPAVEAALEAGERTLYVAPLRALINDQEAALEDFVEGLGFGPQVSVAQYTGQQTQAEKRRVRDRQPHVILTTPDMLHLGILPHAHRLWDWFVESLGTVVLDEVHEYRGVFGSHVALVLRRLARVCERFDVDPRYVCCSATIGNPVEHASAVTGRPEEGFEAFETDTSPAGPRHWLFWNPPLKAGAATDDDAGADATGEPATGGERRSPHPVTARLMADLVQRGHQTLAFTTARQTAERYADQTASLLAERGDSDLAEAVTAYQAALQQSTREAIEGQLRNGRLRGVWSTNALELGIDVGSLDVVLLDTYPGTRMETHQRAGRAGRGTEPSLVTLVAGRDQLDQYLMASPEAFFEEPPERALVNPANPELLPDHVRCAAREHWLGTDDKAHFGEAFPEVVGALTDRDELERRDTPGGVRWTDAGEDNPQLATSLRTIDDREVRLVDDARDETIATLPFADALRDAHPGAIYYHQGRTYEVADLDVDRLRAHLRVTSASDHTRALREKDIAVERELAERTLPSFSGLSVTLAEVTLRERIDSYVRYRGPDDDGERIALEEPLPETTMRTQALLFAVPPGVEQALRRAAASPDDYLGALHALEHGLISLLPLELLCDRRDVGGLSTPVHPYTGRSTVFVHDGHPGGVGLARGGFEAFGSLLAETRDMIEACPCADGCPACVQSPHCGNANEPLTKGLAVELVDHLAGHEA